jgi:transposase
MGAAIELRKDFDGAELRAFAKRSKDSAQTRRLLAVASIYDDGSRSAAAVLGGVGLQTLRDWVLAFNDGGPDGLVNSKAPGKTSILNPEQRRALVEIVQTGPIPAVHGVVRWRLIDLAQWVFDEFQLSISPQTLSRELRGLGYRKLSARPRHHAQNAEAVATFKKSSPPRRMTSPPARRMANR